MLFRLERKSYRFFVTTVRYSFGRAIARISIIRIKVLFPQHFETFQHTEKLKDLHSEQPNIHHPDFIIKFAIFCIITYLAILLPIH